MVISPFAGQLMTCFVPSVPFNQTHRSIDVRRKFCNRLLIHAKPKPNGSSTSIFIPASSNRKLSIHAKIGDFTSSSPQFENIDSSTTSLVKSDQFPLIDRLKTFWQFSRPHTIYGTAISVISILTVSFMYHTIPFTQAVNILLTTLIPALFLNVYIVGLNQLFDIDIDKVNKPYLPLAAGKMSQSQAILTIISALIAGLSFCFATGATSALRIVLVGSVLLGTMYSAPPTRFKRFPLLASIAILTVRGLLVNIGFFLHGGLSSNLRMIQIPTIIKFASIFFVLYGIVIALLKDAPDVQGDRIYGIRTFSVRVGAKAIFNGCVFMLVSMFTIGAVAYGFASQSIVGTILGISSHLAVAGYLYNQARNVNTDSSKEIYKFYMLSWKTFYLEYILLPLAVIR